MEHLLTRECPKGPCHEPERFSASGSWLTCMLWPVVIGHHVFALIRDYLQSPAPRIARGTEGWSLKKAFSTARWGELNVP